MTDKAIYEDGRNYYLKVSRLDDRAKDIPPYSIASLRMYASLTWQRGWRDAKNGWSNAGIYGSGLRKIYDKNPDTTHTQLMSIF